MADRFLDRYLIIDFLSILFGISSWVETSGLMVEMPLLVQQLPEKWKLSSFVSISSQVANVGPLLYVLACRKWTSKVIEKPAIHVTMAVGSTSCFLLIFFWSKTSFVLGEPHSTALLTLAFSIAFVDCTSSLLYLPFMANFKSKYLISCMVGEGISGLLPAIFALIQGVGGETKCREVNYTTNENTTATKWEQYYGEPLFSLEIFFGIMFLMTLISWLAFILMQVLPQAKSEMVIQLDETPVRKEDNENRSILTEGRHNSSSEPETTQHILLMENEKFKKKLIFIILLIYQGASCALAGGILPSIQTYSCLPYGNVAFHLVVTLTSIANPIVCFVSMIVPATTLHCISIHFAAGAICSTYLIITAALSPYPPLAGTLSGEVLIVLLWIVHVILLTYVKACNTSLLHELHGHYGLLWCGGVSQIGSTCGSVLMFVIVNFTDTFQSLNPCAKL